MQQLTLLRERLHMTQEELSEKSGISVRTIQRIESGQSPRGFTLKALAQALGVQEACLLTSDASSLEDEALKWAKIINLSALPMLILPPLNVLVPLLLMVLKKQRGRLVYQLISIQLASLVIAVFMGLLVLMLNDWGKVGSKFTMLIPIAWLAGNSFIICRNGITMGRSDAPLLKPDINFF
ncbi:helix-turn-helix transcriptional regulator [Pedobacter aquatilis]|uniref:helix-turn-helix domain-containing protein n=1 Tax=Pedobacter aquatilis TaxID=351343 RepID=UPI00292E3AB3|nr:helix-turn-helix transcriptional regulator [Pedobacter aquatilis]